MRRRIFLGFSGFVFLSVLLLLFAHITSGAERSIKVNRTEDELRLTYSFPSPSVQRRAATGYDVVHVSGLKMESLPGKPLMPVRTAMVLVPAGKEVAEVRVVAGPKRVLGHFKLEPGAKPVPLTLGTRPSKLLPDAKIYGSDTPYPAQPLGKTTVQRKSGCPMVVANLYPVEYLPKSGQVSYYKDLTLIVQLRPSQEKPRFVPSRIDRFLLRKMVDNPADLKGYLSLPLPAEDSRLLSGAYDYLIITSRALAPAFASLVDWRNLQGLRSAVVCVEDIYAVYPGRDPQEKIRNFLIEAKEVNGISFVLLGGDADREDVGGESENPVVPTRALYAPPVEGDCLVEVVTKAEGSAEGSSMIETLRQFRDTCLHPAYVEKYYRFSPAVTRTLLTHPRLMRQAAVLLTKYTPWLGDLVAGRHAGQDRVLTEENTKELTGFLASLRKEVEKRQNGKYPELARELKGLEDYLSSAAGKSLSEAFWASPYARPKLYGGDGFPLNPPKPGEKASVRQLSYHPQDIAGDLYYACLDGSYDGNGNGIYGEPCDGEDGGDVDLLAELYVGRAPVDSSEEANAFVAKTLAYEKTAPSDSRLKEAWMVGEDLGWEVWGSDYKEEIRNGSSNHGYTTAGFPPIFTVNTLYDMPEREFSKEEVLQVLDSSPHLLNHLGHGYNDYVMKLYNEDVDELKNSGPFLLYTQACYAGSFDNRNDYDWSIDEDCIAEHLVTQQAGAFAMVANSRYGWGNGESTDGSSQRYDREFWDAVFGEGILWLGVANQDSKEDNIGLAQTDDYMRFCYYEINLLGDPATRITNPGQEAVVLSLPETTSAAPGSVVTVPLTVQKTAGVAGFQFTFTWDAPWLTEPQVEKGSLISGDEGWIITAQPDSGILKVMGFNTAGQTLQASEGELLRLTFKVAQDVSPGAVADLRFEDAKVSDAAGQSLPVRTITGIITVAARAKGDVNGDGTVDVLDVVKAVNFALGRTTPTEEERYAADVNEDGVIDILDVVRIVNIALGRA